MSPGLVLLAVVTAYALPGLAFAIPFVLVGVKRLDPVAAHAPWHVRLLFLPGSVALWPVLLRRCLRAGGKR